MSYTVPTFTIDVSWAGAPSYPAQRGNLPASWGGEVFLAPVSLPPASAFGPVTLAWEQFLAPSGLPPPPVAEFGWVLDPEDYRTPQFSVDGFWAGEGVYAPPTGSITATWADITFISVLGIDEANVPEPTLHWTEFASPEGWSSTVLGENFYVIHPWEYAPPEWVLDASWVGKDPYAAPEITVNAAWALPAEETYLSVVGISPGPVPSPAVRGSREFVLPTAWLSSYIPEPADIRNTAVELLPGGIAPPPQTGPQDLRQIPTPRISFWVQYAEPEGIKPGPFGTTRITHEFQFIDLSGRGFRADQYGVAMVGYRVRYLEATLGNTLLFPPPNIAHKQAIQPEGWESSFVATQAELAINLQRILHHSGVADPARYGETHIRNEFEDLFPAPWLSSEFNFPVVYNLTQQVFVAPYMGTNEDPTQWPNFAPFVENYVRELVPSGFTSARFSFFPADIYNNADAVTPAGLDATLWGGLQVTHRNRPITMTGWEEFYSASFTVVHNAAEVLAPVGVSATTTYGRGEVTNRNKRLQQYFPYDGETFGEAFIAPAVRTLAPAAFNVPPASFPEVRHDPHPFAPLGFDTYATGGHDVFEVFRRIEPKPLNVFPVPRVGEPIIANRNPTLRVFPSEQSLYGIAQVFNYDTHLTATAGDSFRLGPLVIAFRTRTLRAVAMSPQKLSVLHHIRNLMPDPPSRQDIYPDPIFIGGSLSPGLFGSVEVQVRALFPESILPPNASQDHSVRTNVIDSPHPIFNLLNFGTPVFAADQYIYAESMPPAGEPLPGLPIPEEEKGLSVVANPRLTPHNIYAPEGDTATKQYRDNHPANGQPTKIDDPAKGARTISEVWGTRQFGRTTVTNQHRVVAHYAPYPGSEVSRNVRFTLRRQVVSPRPIRPGPFPLPSIPFTPQDIDLDRLHNGLENISLWGEPSIGFGPEHPQFLFLTGINSQLFGPTRIENKIRHVRPTGIPHRGNPQQGMTNPWGEPLVGYPRTYSWGGYDLTLWGDTRVEHRIRHLVAEAWDSLSLSKTDLGGFNDRMRVTWRNPPGGVKGIPSTASVETPMIAYANREVLARGIISYNEGNPAVKAETQVSPSGWLDTQFGDIDRWEAGKVKPYGDDLQAVGTPRLRHPVRPGGADTSEIGVLHMARPIRPVGMPEIGFAGPSVTDMDGCTNRVVAPPPIFSQQRVPEPEVTG